MTAARMVAMLVGVAIVYTLQFVVGWPWYAAVPAAIVGYVAVRYGGEMISKDRRPVA